MNKIKPQQKFQQLLNEFLHQHGPCQQYLNKLCYMLLTSKHKMESFYSQYQQKMDVFSSLKMLMLAHYTINYSVRLDEGMVEILGKMECGRRGKAEGFLKEVLVDKYRCYLQKRLYRQWEKNQGVEGNEDDAVNEAYRNLNLLESGLGFVHELYTLGRYYVKKHEWIVDFVKGLAMDFCKIYLSIERKIYKVNPLHKEFNQLMIEVQRINDKLQNVYLNRYFARDVMKFSPKLMNRLSNPHRSEIKSSPHITLNKEQDQSTILPPLPEKKTIILQCLGEGFAYRELVNQANQ